MDPAESRLWMAEYRTAQLDGVLDALALRARIAEERNQVLWWLGNGGHPPTLTITVVNYGGLPVPGATVELSYGGSAGAIDQSGTADGSGNVTFTLPSALAGGSLAVGAWFSGYDSSESGFDTALYISAGANAETLTLVAGSAFQFPGAINRTLTDPVFGSVVLPWSSAGLTQLLWTPTTHTVNYTGSGSCASATGVPVKYTFVENRGGGGVPTLQVQYPSSGLSCPASTGGTITINPTRDGTVPGSPITYKLPSGNKLWGGSTASITIA